MESRSGFSRISSRKSKYFVDFINRVQWRNQKIHWGGGGWGGGEGAIISGRRLLEGRWGGFLYCLGPPLNAPLGYQIQYQI